MSPNADDQQAPIESTDDPVPAHEPNVEPFSAAVEPPADVQPAEDVPVGGFEAAPAAAMDDNAVPPPTAPNPAIALLEAPAHEPGFSIELDHSLRVGALPLFHVVVDKLGRLWRFEEDKTGCRLVYVGKVMT
jgi:hypothetical protein